MNPEIFQIENKSAKLRLSDIVGKPIMDDLIRQISKVFGAKAAETGEYTGELTNCLENAADTLEIEIHSPGGSVFDGYTLYNELMSLRQRGVYVTAHINSLAASMASVICMSADKITMVKGGRMMIHDVSQGVQGNAEKLAKAAELCDGLSDEIAEVYSNRTGIGKDEVRAMMKAETWFNAPEAKAKNFIDEIRDLSPKKQPVDIGGENHAVGSMSLLSRLTQPSNIEAIEKITALENQIAGHDAELSELQAKLDTAELALQEASEIAARNIDLEAQVLTIPTFEAKVTELEAKVVELQAANALTPEKIETAAAAKLAAMGHGEPLDLGSAGVTDQSVNTITRAQFDALDHSARNAHIRNGGKITD